MFHSCPHALRPAAPSPRRHPSAPAARVCASASPSDAKRGYAQLQNGSDVRGVALEGVAGAPVTLSPERAAFLAVAFGQWLAARTGKRAGALRVAVGTDPRLSGPALSAAIFAGLAFAGVSPVDIGLATTPACFMSTITPGHAYDGAIMLTASHLPWNRNGMKFFTPQGGLGKKDIAALVDLACAADEAAGGAPPPPPEHKPAVTQFLPVYAAQLVELIRKGVAHPTRYDTPLEGMKVVVDAGNGSGGFFADLVLQPLGADTAGSQFLDPDGHFPNHIPNPEDPGAVASASAAVRRAHADLGVIFDTDVDRSAIVDAAGSAINRNRLIALLSAVVLRDRPGATIVTDSVTSDGLTAFIEAAGGKHLRYKRGYKNVIDKGVELAAAGVDAPLMIETSGHGAMKENYFLDDGAYLAVKCLIEAGRRRLAGQGGLESLLSSLREPLEEAEFRLPLLAPDFKKAGEKVLADFRADAAAGALPGWTLCDVNHEGWRVAIDEGGGKAGWALVRASLHDPLLVANVESEVPGGAAKTTHGLRCWLAARAGRIVDTGALDAAFARGAAWEGRDGAACPVLPPTPGERLGGGTCGDLDEECAAPW